MGLIRQILARRDRRHEIIQLNHEITSLWDEFEQHVAKDSLKGGSDAYESLYSEYRSYVEIPVSKRDQLTTQASVERAHFWGVPLPPQPDHRQFDNEYWTYDRVLQRLNLTNVGHRYVRHEVALEREIKYRPVLSWAAIVISVGSLFISLLKP